jgi:hypothetical protein
MAHAKPSDARTDPLDGRDGGVMLAFGCPLVIGVPTGCIPRSILMGLSEGCWKIVLLQPYCPPHSAASLPAPSCSLTRQTYPSAGNKSPGKIPSVMAC